MVKKITLGKSWEDANNGNLWLSKCQHFLGSYGVPRNQIYRFYILTNDIFMPIMRFMFFGAFICPSV